ncbi:MAG: serine hydrolase [Bacteroidia bacterium]
MKQLLQSITIILIATSSVLAQNITTREYFEETNAILRKGAITYGMEGAAMSIILPNDSTYTTYYGKRKNGEDVDPNRNWHVAGATNLFTSVIVLQLVQEEKLALTDTIGQYMDTKNMVNVSGSITVEELLKSTSGLNEVYSNGGTDVYRDIWDDRKRLWTPRDILAYMPEPSQDKTWNYNNTNGYMLGFLIEDVTGNSLADEFESRIFSTLNFDDAAITSGKSFNMDNLNGVYVKDDERSTWFHDSYLSSRGGNGALIAKPVDVANFMRELFNGNILDIDLVKAMLVKTEGSGQDRGSMMCAKKMTEYRGYQVSIVEVITEEGDTMNWVGHAGSGINNIVAYHWIEKDFTIVISNNDVSSAMTQGALFFELACYTVSVIDNINDPVSINNISNVDVSLFPNPASDQITVKMDSEIESIRIFDAFGKVVYFSTQIVQSTARINLDSNLQSGNYFVSIKHKNGVSTKRIAVLK